MGQAEGKCCLLLSVLNCAGQSSGCNNLTVWLGVQGVAKPGLHKLCVSRVNVDMYLIHCDTIHSYDLQTQFLVQ